MTVLSYNISILTSFSFCFIFFKIESKPIFLNKILMLNKHMGVVTTALMTRPLYYNGRGQ